MKACVHPQKHRGFDWSNETGEPVLTLRCSKCKAYESISEKEISAMMVGGLWKHPQLFTHGLQLAKKLYTPKK